MPLVTLSCRHGNGARARVRNPARSRAMPRGDKSAYPDKQKRQAEHIEEGYKREGISDDEAESRAWATVNKQTGGGKKSGSGRGRSKATTKKAASESAKKAAK